MLNIGRQRPHIPEDLPAENQPTGNGYNVEFEDFVNSGSLAENSGFYVQLFRVRNPQTGRGLAYLRRYTDYIPQPDDIGQQFGPGTYSVTLYYTDAETGRRKTKHRHWHIDQAFHVEGTPATPAQALHGNNGAVVNPVEMFRAMAELMRGMVPDDRDGRMDRMIAASERSVLRMFESAQKTIATATNAQMRRVLNPPAEKQPEERSIMEHLLSTVIEQLPKFLSGGPLMRKMMAKNLGSRAEAKFVLQHPDIYKSVWREMVNAGRVREEDLSALCDAAGFPTPDELDDMDDGDQDDGDQDDGDQVDDNNNVSENAGSNEAIAEYQRRQA